MPRTYKRKVGGRSYGAYSEESLENALRDIRSRNLTQRQTSVKYGIPRSTLKYKLKGAHAGKPGGPTIFSQEEEETFKAYVITASNYGFPVDELDLRLIVKAYADKKGIRIRQFRNNVPGQDWMKSFIKRHRDLTVRLASNIKRKRAEVSDTVINEYFANLTGELHGVDPGSIWNYDETNLTDEPGQKKVIMKRGCKYPERVMNSTKSSTSLMFCGNATGELLPPYVVYKADCLWTTWTQNGPTRTRYNRSKSGWFDHVCFEDWFFSTLMPRLKKGRGKQVLIGDNLSSHISLAVLEACKKNNISFVSLPPNSTHLTQPLDVAYFRPMKVAWRKILTEWKEGKGRKLPSIPKDEFPRLLSLLMAKLKDKSAENLMAGFRKTGISPIDKSQVLSRLPQSAASVSGTSSTIELVSQSFIDHITAARHGSNDKGVVRARRRKVSCAAGKSIAAEDIAGPSQMPQKKHRKKAENQDTADVGDHSTRSDSEAENPEVPRVSDGESSVGDSDVEAFNVEADTDTSTTSPGVRSKHTTILPNEGDFVLVTYEGDHYPGEVKSVKKNGFQVSCMVKTGQYWKWPSKPDLLLYPPSDIIQLISEPKKISRRGLFSVQEMAEK